LAAAFFISDFGQSPIGLAVSKIVRNELPRMYSLSIALLQSKNGLRCLRRAPTPSSFDTQSVQLDTCSFRNGTGIKILI
jgi:hypothetical protein